MTPQPFDRYPRTAWILLGLAGIVMLIALFSNRGDMTGATLVLVAFACFFAGLVLTTFHTPDPVSGDVAGLLAVHGSIGTARLCADLGVQGHAHFIPARSPVPEEILQYNPVSVFHPVDIASNDSFHLEGEQKGIVSRPAGYSLYETLLRDHALRIPREEAAILETIREVGEDVLEVADRVEARRAGDDILVELTGYRLAAGCRAVRNESPKCCTMAPCPVCSLFGCILCRGLDQPVAVKSITADPAAEGILLVLSPVG